MVRYETQLQYGPLGPYPPHAPIYHTWRLAHRVIDTNTSWDFTFEDNGDGIISSTVAMPGGDSREYTHDRLTSEYSARIYLTNVETKIGSSRSELTTYAWSASPFPVGAPLTI